MIESKNIIDMEKTGNNLRKYAYENGYSVRDIQQYLGLSCPQPIYRWFKGAILPSVDNLFRLSELFHIHMEELLVKKHSAEMCEEFTFIVNDSSMFFKRMKAYISLLVT